jgi:ADP-ribose pyrophosphatase YjhB (NUDIX family)
MKTKRKRKIELHKLNYPKGVFLVVTLGIVFDTKTRKILIGRRINDPYTKKLTWGFPGGVPEYYEDLEKSLERTVKEKTGLKVKNLGCIFARIFKDNKKILLTYYLCEVVGGKERVGQDFIELKWVTPKEAQKHFTTFFDPRVKEYLMNLK